MWDVNSGVLVSQLLGALALTGFAWVFFIATRARPLDALFDGLDKAYLTHKWLGIGSVALVVAHLITMHAADDRPADGYGRQHPEGLGALGLPSLALFVVLVLVTLLAGRTSYENWKATHLILVLSYALGLAHYSNTSAYGNFSLSPFSLWLNLVNLCGVLAATYVLVFNRKFAFRYKYEVAAVRSVAVGTVELTGTPKGRAMSHRPGQFAFMKLSGRRIRFPSHPFTISSSPKAQQIQFTIKSLGDHTAHLGDAIEVGDEFALSGPHGRFDYTKASRRQLWIAGGIGITPFRSFLASAVPAEFSVDLFYAYHGHAQAAYLDELTAMATGNLRLHLVDDTVDGFLTAAQIEQQIDGGTPVDVFFCGPEPLRRAIKSGLRRSQIEVLSFHAEAFRFGR
ncbi:MAG: ferric reductase-like transmembrane domain-containing protein [Micrococcales bacterium]|nr:ferric reductase-like transmembrane domain-containing protein [Micrococcales bacterium]